MILILRRVKSTPGVVGYRRECYPNPTMRPGALTPGIEFILAPVIRLHIGVDWHP